MNKKKNKNVTRYIQDTGDVRDDEMNYKSQIAKKDCLHYFFFITYIPESNISKFIPFIRCGAREKQSE